MKSEPWLPHTLGFCEIRWVRQLSLLTTVSYCPYVLLANQDILKHTSPTPEQRLTTHCRLGLIHYSTRAFLPFCCFTPRWWLTADGKARQLAGNYCSDLCPLKLAMQKCQSSDVCEQIVPSRFVLNTEICHRCMVSQSNSWLLLLGYTIHLPQHLLCTGSVDQVAAVSQDKPADSAEKTP